MRIIFLDIDGVLNCSDSKSRCGSFIGIDNKKVKLLKQIVYETGAKIVLSSSWRIGWDKNSELCDSHGVYLNNKLRKSNLFILDRTKSLSYRGEEIKQWIDSHNVEEWVVLDDEIFRDYKELGILEHLVKTTFYDEGGGLRDEHVKQAIKILKGEKVNERI